MPDPQYPFLANPTAARFDLLTAQVLRIMTGGDPTADSVYDKREVRLMVEQATTAQQAAIDTANKDKSRAATIENQAFQKAQYFEDMDALYKFGATAEAFIQTFRKWPVLTDADTGERYSLLPEPFVKIKRYQNLPGEEAVRSVEPVRLTDRHKRRYIPLNAGQYQLLSRGGIGLEGNYGFYREGEKLFYVWQHGTPPPPDTELQLSVVIRADRDGLVAPGLIADAQDVDIIARAVALLQRRAQEDKVNDNVANQA